MFNELKFLISLNSNKLPSQTPTNQDPGQFPSASIPATTTNVSSTPTINHMQFPMPNIFQTRNLNPNPLPLTNHNPTRPSGNSSTATRGSQANVQTTISYQQSLTSSTPFVPNTQFSNSNINKSEPEPQPLDSLLAKLNSSDITFPQF